MSGKIIASSIVINQLISLILLSILYHIALQPSELLQKHIQLKKLVESKLSIY